MTRKRDTFQKLAPELRDALAVYLKRARCKDRQSPDLEGWVSQSRGLEEYFFCLGVMPSYLDGWLVQRSIKDDVRVFEAGIGDFVFGRELLQRYGEWMRTDGLRLTYSERLRAQAGLKQRIGMMESVALHGPFDLAFSARGAFVYSLNSFAALEGLIGSMKRGGIAYIDDAKLLLPKKWFRDYLRSQGVDIVVTRYEKGGPYAYRLRKKFAGKLDLAAFSGRYLERLSQNSQLIQEWGFDRTVRGSPLTSLLSSLYESEHYSDLSLPFGKEAAPAAQVERRSLGERELEISQVGKVTYVNDAAAQRADDSEAAAAQWKGRRIFWISGGDGLLTPDQLGLFPIHAALFYGVHRSAMAERWNHLPMCLSGQELKDVMEKAYHVAAPGDVVLFSPGLPAEAEIHGTWANRAEEFDGRLAELRELCEWNGA